MKRKDIVAVKNYRRYVIHDMIPYIILQNKHDIRILHLLWEHKVIMTKRIEFLYMKKVLSLEQFNTLFAISKKIKNNVCMLRNMQIKNKISENKSFMEKLKNELLKIKKSDEMLISMLVQDLMNYCYNKKR